MEVVACEEEQVVPEVETWVGWMVAFSAAFAEAAKGEMEALEVAATEAAMVAQAEMVAVQVVEEAAAAVASRSYCWNTAKSTCRIGPYWRPPLLDSCPRPCCTIKPLLLPVAVKASAERMAVKGTAANENLNGMAEAVVVMVLTATNASPALAW